MAPDSKPVDGATMTVCGVFEIQVFKSVGVAVAPGLTGTPRMGREPRTMGRGRSLRTVILFALAAAGALVLWACDEMQAPQQEAYVLRLGNRMVSIYEFKTAVEVAQSAYSQKTFQDPSARRVVQARVLGQLMEEMVLLERARELGISVSDADVDRAADEIRADYPGDIFERTLLESAVSLQDWKEGLKRRLLVERVIEEDLAARIDITADEIAEYYESERGHLEEQGASAPDDITEQVTRQLRRRKAEAAYGDWLAKLRKAHPVVINARQWRMIREH